MITQLDKRIDSALNILGKSKDCIAELNDFESFKDLPSDHDIMTLLSDRGLANKIDYHLKANIIKPPSCRISEKGLDIFKNGGWIKYLENEKQKESLEISLAKSNLKANKLNKKITKKNAKNERLNKIVTIINIIIGLLNIGLLIWQIFKAE